MAATRSYERRSSTDIGRRCAPDGTDGGRLESGPHARPEGPRPVRADRRPACGDRVAGRWHQRRAQAPGAARRDRHRQDLHGGARDRVRAEADAGDGPQQDARRAALPGVQGVLPRQRGRVFRELLRLLPAGGLPAPDRYVHREGLVAQRRDRSAAAQRHARALRAPGRGDRRLGVGHLRPRRAGRLRRDGDQPEAGRALPARRDPASPRRPAVPAQRRRPRAREVPRARRRPRGPATARRIRRADRLLRRRGGADRRDRRPDRRGARRADRGQPVSGQRTT